MKPSQEKAYSAVVPRDWDSPTRRDTTARVPSLCQTCAIDLAALWHQILPCMPREDIPLSGPRTITTCPSCWQALPDQKTLQRSGAGSAAFPGP